MFLRGERRPRPPDDDECPLRSAGGTGRIHRLLRRSLQGGPGREVGRASPPCGPTPSGARLASNGVDLEVEAVSRSLEAALEVARSSRRIDLEEEAVARNRSRSRVF